MTVLPEDWPDTDVKVEIPESPTGPWVSLKHGKVWVICHPDDLATCLEILDADDEVT